MTEPERGCNDFASVLVVDDQYFNIMAITA